MWCVGMYMFFSLYSGTMAILPHQLQSSPHGKGLSRCRSLWLHGRYISRIKDQHGNWVSQTIYDGYEYRFNLIIEPSHTHFDTHNHNHTHTHTHIVCGCVEVCIVCLFHHGPHRMKSRAAMTTYSTELPWAAKMDRWSWQEPRILTSKWSSWMPSANSCGALRYCATVTFPSWHHVSVAGNRTMRVRELIRLTSHRNFRCIFFRKFPSFPEFEGWNMNKSSARNTKYQNCIKLVYRWPQ